MHAQGEPPTLDSLKAEIEYIHKAVKDRSPFTSATAQEVMRGIQSLKPSEVRLVTKYHFLSQSSFQRRSLADHLSLLQVAWSIVGSSKTLSELTQYLLSLAAPNTKLAEVAVRNRVVEMATRKSFAPQTGTLMARLSHNSGTMGFYRVEHRPTGGST